MPSKKGDVSNIPTDMLRTKKPILPEQAELDVVRHYTQLFAQKLLYRYKFLSTRFLYYEIQF